MIRNVIFDLDGTLSNSVPGIARSVQYALGELGRPSIDEAVVSGMIGQSLRSMFATLLDSDQPAIIEAAVTAYRKRYFDTGLYENRLYDGVVEMLETLAEQQYRLYVATSKVKPIAIRVVEHFGLTHRFSAIHGSELDGTRDDKGALLAHVLETDALRAEECVMVGDRKHDMLAAQAVGCRSLGVTYGYGAHAELVEHRADFVCGHPREIPAGISALDVGT